MGDIVVTLLVYHEQLSVTQITNSAFDPRHGNCTASYILYCSATWCRKVRYTKRACVDDRAGGRVPRRRRSCTGIQMRENTPLRNTCTPNKIVAACIMLCVHQLRTRHVLA